LIIFDPNFKYLTNITSKPGIRLNFKKIKNSQVKSHCDQFKPYDNIFDCEIFQENFNYNGTLIRLPLRNEPSKISNKIYDNEQEINSLFEILFKNLDSLLLFTQSVKKIQVYVIDDSESKPHMNLLFEHQNSPVQYIQKHSVILKSNNNLFNEFKQQTSILRAANENLNTNIETALIVEASTKIYQENLTKQFKNFNYSKNLKLNSFWMIVSLIEHNNLYASCPELKNFIPCVGMATELEKDKDWFKLKANNEKNGLAFCFLPLPIETNLNYHINANFILSGDRLQLYESNRKDDKQSFKHVWNVNLLNPLINNLLRMIDLVVKNFSFEKDSLVQNFWPIKSKTNYFNNFENKFYNDIIQRDTLYVYPALKQNGDFYLSQFKDSHFVNFNLKSVQELAINVACFLVNNENLNLVCLKDAYYEIFKRKLIELKISDRLIDDYGLLKKLIDNKNLLDFFDYEKLIIHYLTNNEINSTISYLLKTTECIPTAFRTFKSISKLINPNGSKFYSRLFNLKSDKFPSECICSDTIAMINLKFLGIINERLPNEMIFNLAINVEDLFLNDDLDKSKQLSLDLLGYISSLNTENLKDLNINDLMNLKWVFAKKKPQDWHLAWCSQEFDLYKPNELINDQYQLLVGIVQPVFDSSTSLMIANSLDSNVDTLINYCFDQLKRLIEEKKVLNTKQISQIEEFFKQFYLFLQKNIDINNEVEYEKKIADLKPNLPKKWIFCRDNQRDKFLSIESFAFEVKNPIEPVMLQIPSIYASNVREKYFFEKIGIPKYFSLENLRQKLECLKKKNGDNPLDDYQLDMSRKLAFEMIAQDKNLKLKELCNNKNNETHELYLPDNDKVLRNIKDLCVTMKCASFNFIKPNNMFLLDDHIPNEFFGIEYFEKKFLLKHGKFFGQKEKLVNRIKDIIDNRYSSTASIFKELIQNADDAGATEIR